MISSHSKLRHNGTSEFHKPIDQFIEYLSVEKGASGNTVAAYKNDLQQLADYISEHLSAEECKWGSVTRTVIQDFIIELKSRGYTETSVARKVAALRSYFVFLSAEGSISRNPADGLASPRVGKSLPKAISLNEVDELLEQPARRGTPEARRDRAMLELLYATGMRVTELVSLDRENVSLGAQPYVKCLGKNSKERSIPIHEQAVEALNIYLEEARPGLAHPEETALFVNRRGERLTRQGFWLILKGYAKAAGLGREVTPHTLRHSFATHMLKGGMPLRSVQEMLGHANISTTQVYTHLNSDYVRKEYQKAHPRA